MSDREQFEKSHAKEIALNKKRHANWKKNITPEKARKAGIRYEYSRPDTPMKRSETLEFLKRSSQHD